MHMLDRRVQILLDDARHRRLTAAARDVAPPLPRWFATRSTSRWPAGLAKKRVALEAIRAAEPMPVPKTVEELKADLGELRSGGL